MIEDGYVVSIDAFAPTALKHDIRVYAALCPLAICMGSYAAYSRDWE